MNLILLKTTTKDEGDLQEQCENLNSAILAIDNVAKKLDLELMYGGIRLMSVRLTKRFFKIIVVLYAYEIYYFLYAIIAIEYFEMIWATWSKIYHKEPININTVNNNDLFEYSKRITNLECAGH